VSFSSSIIFFSFLSLQNKVLFVHRGVSFGRFVLFVSDGKHYVSTMLEVIIMPFTHDIFTVSFLHTVILVNFTVG